MMYRLQTIQQTDSHGDTFVTINIIDENARIIFQTFPSYDKDDFQEIKFQASKAVLINNLFPEMVAVLELVEDCLINKEKKCSKKYVKDKVWELLTKIKC